MERKELITVESYYEGDLSPSEEKKLRERFPVLKRHFTSYQHLDVFRRNGKVVALVVDGCIIHTHRGEFSRSYANRLLKISVKGWDDNYLYVVVANGLNKVKRLDISLPIEDDSLVNE